MLCLDGPSTPAWLARVFAACVVQGCAELRAVCLRARLPAGRALAGGCAGVKVKLDQLLDTRGDLPVVSY